MLRLSALLWFLTTWLGACATADRASSNGTCHKYLVMPPEHFDEVASDFVLHSWIGVARHRLKKCDSIVDPARATEVFHLVEVSHDDHVTKSSLTPAMIETLKEKTGATDAVYIKFKVTGNDGLDMVATVYQLSPLRRVANSAVGGEASIELPSSHPFKGVASFRLVDAMLNLLPNAAGLGLIAQSKLDNRRVTANLLAESGEQSKGLLPPYLSSFSFVNLKHPDGMALWDYDWKLNGAMSFVYVNSLYGYAPKDASGNQLGEPNAILYGLVLFMMVPSVNETLSLHWPLGTTFFSLGVGPGLYSYNDSLGNHNSAAAVVWRMTVGHRVFLSERWFINGIVSMLIPNRLIVDNPIFQLNDYQDVTLGFGYYFPELKSWGRAVF